MYTLLFMNIHEIYKAIYDIILIKNQSYRTCFEITDNIKMFCGHYNIDNIYFYSYL